MNDEDAISGLKRLGLTTYEARVFLALQKLGSATASEVSDVADVPRSQVYGAADGLVEHGLVETQQTTPTVYRPVPIEQARTHLLDQLAETGAETFDYIDGVRGTEQREERTESIWMIQGRESVTSRTAQLAEEADDRLLYAIRDPDLVPPAIVESFQAARDRGVDVVLASADETVLERAAEGNDLPTYRVPSIRSLDLSTARLLVVDEGTVLLSTLSRNGNGETGDEVAFWTSESAFASVLVELAEAWLQDPFE